MSVSNSAVERSGARTLMPDHQTMQGKEKGEYSLSLPGTNTTSQIQRTHPQKCDAKQPCTTCIDADIAPECEYETVNSRLRLSGEPQFVLWHKPCPSSSSDSSSQGCWDTGEAVPEFPANPPVTTVTQFLPAPPERALIRPLGSAGLPPNTPPEPRPLTTDEVGTHNPPRITLPPFSVLFSLMFPSILPEPHFTLSLLGAERLQLSDVALGELDMKLYVSRAR